MAKTSKKDKIPDFEKLYYLPAWRSQVVGVMLLLMGFGLAFMGVDFNNTLWQNLQWILIDFSSWGMFLLSLLLMLPFKLLFLGGGYVYLRHARGITRAKLDEKGFYYQTIPKGGRLSKAGIDLNEQTFITYGHIKNITYRKSAFTGAHLDLETYHEKIPLLALDVLRDKDKHDIVETINTCLALRRA